MQPDSKLCAPQTLLGFQRDGNPRAQLEDITRTISRCLRDLSRQALS